MPPRLCRRGRGDVGQVLHNLLGQLRQVQRGHDGGALRLRQLELGGGCEHQWTVAQQRTHLEVRGDVGQLEVLGEVKLRQVAHVGEVEQVPVLQAALGAAVQRRNVLARGSYTDRHHH